MMKYLIGSCHEVSILMAKNEEDKLSAGGNFKLWLHTFLCAFCRKFQKQMNIIAEEILHVDSREELSSAAKGRIQRILTGHSPDSLRGD